MGDNSEMARKKSAVDFDFSDIAGQTTQVKSIEGMKDVLQDEKIKNTQDPGSTQTSKPKEKATGYVIAIPCGKGQFSHKDIAECTSEEFVAWAKMYYPVVTAGPDRFVSISTRIRAFQQIVSWHQSMMRPEVREKIN